MQNFDMNPDRGFVPSSFFGLCFYFTDPSGGGQHLERPNVERLIFRDFEISNIKISKVELFDFSIFEFIFYFYDCLNFSDTQNTYMIIYYQIQNFWNFNSYTNCQILKICWLFKFNNFRDLIILWVCRWWKCNDFWNCKIGEIFEFFFFHLGKPKFDSENWQILVLFVPSIFRTIRNFADSHICS